MPTKRKINAVDIPRKRERLDTSHTSPATGHSEKGWPADAKALEAARSFLQEWFAIFWILIYLSLMDLQCFCWHQNPPPS